MSGLPTIENKAGKSAAARLRGSGGVAPFQTCSCCGDRFKLNHCQQVRIVPHDRGIIRTSTAKLLRRRTIRINENQPAAIEAIIPSIELRGTAVAKRADKTHNPLAAHSGLDDGGTTS